VGERAEATVALPGVHHLPRIAGGPLVPDPRAALQPRLEDVQLGAGRRPDIERRRTGRVHHRPLGTPPHGAGRQQDGLAAARAYDGDGDDRGSPRPIPRRDPRVVRRPERPPGTEMDAHTLDAPLPRPGVRHCDGMGDDVQEPPRRREAGFLPGAVRGSTADMALLRPDSDHHRDDDPFLSVRLHPRGCCPQLRRFAARGERRASGGFALDDHPKDHVPDGPPGLPLRPGLDLRPDHRRVCDPLFPRRSGQVLDPLHDAVPELLPRSRRKRLRPRHTPHSIGLSDRVLQYQGARREHAEVRDHRWEGVQVEPRSARQVALADLRGHHGVHDRGGDLGSAGRIPRSRSAFPGCSGTPRSSAGRGTASGSP